MHSNIFSNIPLRKQTCRPLNRRVPLRGHTAKITDLEEQGGGGEEQRGGKKEWRVMEESRGEE